MGDASRRPVEVDRSPQGHAAPPRPLLVVDHLRLNGANRLVVQVASRWVAEGASIVVLHEVPDDEAVTTPPELPVEHLVPRGRRLRWGLARALGQLWRQARRSEVVVCGSEIGPGVLLARMTSFAARRPLVISVHADLDAAITEWVPGWQAPLLRWVHRSADAALCVDSGVVPALLRVGLPPERAHVVRNGIDLDAVRAAGAGPDVYTSDGTGDTLPTLVATGRIAHQKGYDLLVEAHARVVGSHPHRVLVLNDGPDRAAVEALAAERGVSGTFVVLGAVPPWPTVARAAAFVLPSRHEGLPLALLEAMALGVPCIAAESSDGVVAALEGGLSGELVPVEDVEALAGAMAAHLAHPEVLAARARRARERSQEYGLDAMADGWARVLRAAQHR